VFVFQLIVFKPFFLSLNLPYAVIRGEEFGLQITVFNYLSSELQVHRCSWYIILYKLTANYNYRYSISETCVIMHNEMSCHLWQQFEWIISVCQSFIFSGRN